MRKVRTLKEIVEEAESLVSNPNTDDTVSAAEDRLNWVKFNKPVSFVLKRQIFPFNLTLRLLWKLFHLLLTSLQIQPQFPKIPRPPNVLYFEKNLEKFQRRHPERDTQKLLKSASKKFNKLPEEEKVKSWTGLLFKK